jgi:hypothetical protein
LAFHAVNIDWLNCSKRNKRKFFSKQPIKNCKTKANEPLKKLLKLPCHALTIASTKTLTKIIAPANSINEVASSAHG